VKVADAIAIAVVCGQALQMLLALTGVSSHFDRAGRAADSRSAVAFGRGGSGSEVFGGQSRKADRHS
jgi:hypothetical protein